MLRRNAFETMLSDSGPPCRSRCDAGIADECDVRLDPRKIAAGRQSRLPRVDGNRWIADAGASPFTCQPSLMPPTNDTPTGAILAASMLLHDRERRIRDSFRGGRGTRCLFIYSSTGEPAEAKIPSRVVTMGTAENPSRTAVIRAFGKCRPGCPRPNCGSGTNERRNCRSSRRGSCRSDRGDSVGPHACGLAAVPKFFRRIRRRWSSEKRNGRKSNGDARPFREGGGSLKVRSGDSPPTEFRFAGPAFAENLQRLENCVPRRAPRRPYFLRSFFRASKVRSPASRSGFTTSGSSLASARAIPNPAASA